MFDFSACKKKPRGNLLKVLNELVEREDMGNSYLLMVTGLN